jgi:WD40 repeat protein
MAAPDATAALIADWTSLCALRLDDAAEALGEAAEPAASAAHREGLRAARRAGPQEGASARAEAPAAFHSAAAAGGGPAGSHGESAGLERVAATAVSLAFLREFYERCVAPLPGGAALTTKQVVTDLIMPATAARGAPSFASLVPRAVSRPTAFASHAFNNPFSLLVAALSGHFADAVASEVFVWVDVFAINQHDPGADLHGGRALARTIELAAQTLVVLDRTAFPLTRLWCLYEMGSTPPAKLLFLTYGFSEADVAAAFRLVDVETAQCFDSNDTNRIREHIVAQHRSLASFQQLLRLRLLLKPTSYEADCEALLARSTHDEWRFEELRAFVSDSASSDSRLACIAGGPGEGKSTLAAALCASASPLLVHARHFCKASDVRRQDVGAIIRSLSYQLAQHFPSFAAAVLALSPADAESLTDPAKAWELLLKRPLITLQSDTRVVLLFDALDEAGGGGSRSDAISKVLSLILDLGRLDVHGGVASSDSETESVWETDSEGTTEVEIVEVPSALSIIVTTRPEERAIMAPLRGCWRGDSFMQLAPAALRADATESPKLLQLLQQRLPAGAAEHSIDAAYQAIFQAASSEQAHGTNVLLAIVLSARQPPSMAQLEALGVRGACASLPGWGFLFHEREHCVHLLHRSLAEWLTDATRSGRFTVDAAVGHAVWAEHCNEQLRAWMEPASDSPGCAPAAPPPAGSYMYAHALPHFDAAGRDDEARTLLLRLPWLQATLRERGLYALLSDIAARMAPGDGALWTLHRTLRLASPGLQGADAAEALPSQLVGRLGGLPGGALASALVRLHDEAHAWTGSLAWLRPLRNSLQQPVGALELCMEGHTDCVTSLAVLGDGRVVSGSDDKTLRVWNAATGECERTLDGHTDRVKSLAVLGDGRVVSGSDDDTLRVWNAATGECERTLEGHTYIVTSLAVLGDGRVVSGSGDKTLRVWNAATGECERTLEGHTDWISSSVVLGDGRVVSGSGDKTLRVWNVTTGECERTLEGHTDCVTSLAVLGDGRVVSGSDDNTLRVWNAATGECERTLDGHTDRVKSLAVLGDGRVVSGSDDNTLRVWNVTTGECERTLEGHTDCVTSLAVLGDGRVVSGSGDNTLRVWNLTTGECERTLEGHSRPVSFAVLGDGRVVSGSDDKTLRVWNVTTGECERTLEGHTTPVRLLVVLADGRVVSGSGDKTLRLWNATVSGSCDNTLRVWNATTGECERTLEGHSRPVSSFAVLGDGRVVSGSDDKTLRVWNAATGECERTLEGHMGLVRALAVLGDGRVVSGSSDHSLRVWNATTGECERTLEGHTGSVSSLAVLGDGRVLSESPHDETQRVWNADTGECCSCVPWQSAEAVSMLALPRLQQPHAIAVTNNELSDAGSCLVGAGFARTYVDAAVTVCACMLAPPTCADMDARQAAAAHTVVAGTTGGVVHFFTIVR